MFLCLNAGINHPLLNEVIHYYILNTATLCCMVVFLRIDHPGSYFGNLFDIAFITLTFKKA